MSFKAIIKKKIYIYIYIYIYIGGEAWIDHATLSRAIKIVLAIKNVTCKHVKFLPIGGVYIA